MRIRTLSLELDRKVVDLSALVQQLVQDQLPACCGFSKLVLLPAKTSA